MWLIFVQAPTTYQSNPAWSTWTRWSHKEMHQLSSSGHIKTWWNGWAGYWLEKWLVPMRILAQ
jgi:hypothetical protein